MNNQKKHENPIFSKTISKIKNSQEQKVFFFFQFYICCVNFSRIGPYIKNHPLKNGSVPWRTVLQASASFVPDWGPIFALLRELFFNLIYSAFNYILKMHRKQISIQLNIRIVATGCAREYI